MPTINSSFKGFETVKVYQGNHFIDKKTKIHQKSLTNKSQNSNIYTY